MSADPAEAPVGDTITIKGTGFSIVPAENVISAGGASVVAETFGIASDGNEEITFDVPAEAPEGESPLLVIVNGHPSNALTFTVTP